MYAPMTRSMTLTLGLLSSALSPHLLADTEIKDESQKAPVHWNSTAPASLPKDWAQRLRTPAPTPPALQVLRPNST